MHEVRQVSRLRVTMAGRYSIPHPNPGPAMKLLAFALFVSALCSLHGGCTSPVSAVEELGQELGALEVHSLSCELLVNPMGIDTRLPRLAWKLRSTERGQLQSAWRVLVASSPDELHAGAADLWDSGRVESGESVSLDYGGKPLTSRQRCYWRVRVWDARGEPSAWSEPASWEMGLLEAGDWSARWIEDGKPLPESDEAHYLEDPAPLFRKEFELGEGIERARLYVTGLGYYEASLNGERVGDRALDPLWTAYDERVFYSTYDVTELVGEGRNALGLIVGNGWFNPLPLRMWGHLNLREVLSVGRPRAIAQLEVEYENGRKQTIASDASWKTAPGPLLRNNIYLGEVYDARRELRGWDQAGLDESEWKAITLAPEGLGALQSQPTQPIRVLGSIAPVARSEPSPGVFILDLGQNFAGWARLRVEGLAGTRVRLRFGELLHEDGTLNPLTAVCGQIKGPGRGGPGAPDVAVQEDVYVLRGGGVETYTPRFSFHGFRYVELRGYPGVPSLDAITGLPLACDVEPAGHFACSNERLNRIDEMVRWTFLSNLFGVQSDCPHRERFGYGGDIVPTCEAFMAHFDMSSFYPKVVRDFADSTLTPGALPMTAPHVGIGYAGLEEGGSPVGWSIAHPVLVRELYRWYGDRRIVEQQYANARRWIDYVVDKSEGLVLEQGLSDHEGLAEKPVRVTSTAFFARGAELVAEFARVLGRDEEAARYAELAAGVRAAFADELVASDSGAIGVGTQAAQAVALAGDLVPAAAREAAFSRIVDPLQTAEASLSTGIFGTRDLLDVLCREGRADLAYALVDRPDFPGWGYMLERGATTLWEHWQFSDDTYSHNHPMFGSVSTWMFRWLAGIAPAPDAIGFDRVLMRPQLAEGLTWVRGDYESVRGKIESAWRLQGETFRWRISLPPGVTGEVVLPPECDPDRILESGRPIDSAPGIEVLAPGSYRVTSGSFQISAPLKPLSER